MPTVLLSYLCLLCVLIISGCSNRIPSIQSQDTNADVTHGNENEDEEPVAPCQVRFDQAASCDENKVQPEIDSDGDGVSDEHEIALGSDPYNAHSDNDGLPDGREVILGTDPTKEDTDGDGFSDADEEFLGRDPLVKDETCATGSDIVVENIVRPVDIIFVVDNSATMTEEIAGIQKNINKNFAERIEESGVDYHVIMLSEHGDLDDESICVEKPLSGRLCPAPNARKTPPVNTDRFFHYSHPISSFDSLDRIIETYDKADRYNFSEGWHQWLRKDSIKFFIEFTDEDFLTRNVIYESPEAFDDKLLSLDPAQFGTKDARRYVFHSVVGMQCEDAENSGLGFQKLSQLTGGLVFPICQHREYPTIFREVAQEVIGSSAPPCHYVLPDPPSEDPIDTDRMLVIYTPENEEPAQLTRAPNAEGCTDDGWYLANSEVVLCPSLCAAVEMDASPEVKIHVACEEPLENDPQEDDPQEDDPPDDDRPIIDL